MSGNRLMTAALVLGVLLALTVWQFQARKSEDAGTAETTAKLPKLDREKLDGLEITAPGKPTVTLSKNGESWTLTQPISAQADKDAVDSALAKLAELEAVGIAATKAENHEKLEIDDTQAIHVVAKQEGKTVADLFVGGLRNGNTMVREQGSPLVISAEGSFKYAFEKELKEWRDRTIVETDADKLASATFQSGQGTLRFVRTGDGSASAWAQAADDKPLAGFDGEKAKAVIASTSHLHATDFAAPELTREAAGLAPTPAATVTLQASEAGAAPIVLHVGAKVGDEYYAAREGSEPIYVVSQFSGERLLGAASLFVKDEPKPENSGAVPATSKKPAAATPKKPATP